MERTIVQATSPFTHSLQSSQHLVSSHGLHLHLLGEMQPSQNRPGDGWKSSTLTFLTCQARVERAFWRFWAEEHEGQTVAGFGGPQPCFLQ